MKKINAKKLKPFIIAVAVILVIAIVGAFSPTLYRIATFEKKVQGFEETKPDALRIMSFNVRYSNVGNASMEDRIGIVSQTMLDSCADSIGVQEATPQWIAAFNETISDKYAYVGVGRDNGVDEGEYAAIYYLKDKYTVVDSGTFWLSETPDTPSIGWDAKCYRICTWAVLENIQTKEQYVHLNSHFDYDAPVAMVHSAEMIVEKAEEYTDLPLVFTADMNAAKGSETYATATESGTLIDVKYTAPDTMDYLTYHDTKPYNFPAGYAIDHIMVNSHFEALSYKVVSEGYDGKYVSDHFPIYADIAVK